MLPKCCVVLLLTTLVVRAAHSADVKPAGPATPEMLSAMNRLSDAGIVEGKRGSLTFFRWTSTSPPKLAHLGLWGPKIDNELFALIAALPDLERS